MLFSFCSSPSYFNACCPTHFPSVFLDSRWTVNYQEREPQHRTDIRLANPPAKTHFKPEHIRGLTILGRHRISEHNYNVSLD